MYRTHTHTYTHIYTYICTYMLYLFCARSKARESRRGGLQFRLSIHRRENTSLSLISTYVVFFTLFKSPRGYFEISAFVRLKILTSAYTPMYRSSHQGAQRTLSFSRQYDSSSFQKRPQSGLLSGRLAMEI